jgi:hypothetical protein
MQLTSRDSNRFATMRAATVTLPAHDDGILLAGDSYTGKSRIAGAPQHPTAPPPLASKRSSSRTIQLQ